MNRANCIVIGVAVFAAFLAVSEGDYRDAKDQLATDCEMVKMWNEDRRAGIAPTNRRGYPVDRQTQETCKNETP